MKSNRVMVVAATLTFSVTGLAACQSGTGPKSSTAFKTGGTLTAARAADVITWDPAYINDNDSLWAASQVEGTLLKATPDGKALQPYIADSYKISPDGLTYTFKLNPAAKFCDGSQITSADVLYTFERASSKTAVVVWQYPEGMKLSAPDAETVKIQLKVPEAAFKSFITLWGTAIVSKSYGTQAGKQALATKPMGSGPFCLKAWQRGTEIDLVKNGHFWLKDEKGRSLPYLDEIKWRIIADDNARMLALQAGEVQVVTPVPAAQAESVSHGPGTSVGKTNLLGTVSLFANMKNKCLSDVNVRQALNFAIDRPALIKSVLNGQGVPATNPLFNARWSTDKYAYTFDKGKAKTLMAQSSCSQGFTTSVQYNAGDSEAQRSLTIIKSFWQAIGVNLELRSVESGTLVSNENAGQFDLYQIILTNDIYDPAENLHLVMLPASVGGSDAGFTRWSNADVTKLVLQAEKATDEGMRGTLYDQIQKIYMGLGPQIYLYSPSIIWGTRANVHGFSESPTGGQNFQQTWIG